MNQYLILLNTSWEEEEWNMNSNLISHLYEYTVTFFFSNMLGSRKFSGMEADV